MQKQGIFSRFFSLISGIFTNRIEGAELANPDIVYKNASSDLHLQREELKEALTRLIYMRNRLVQEEAQHRSDLSMIEKALTTSLNNDEDEKALSLIAKKRSLSATQTRKAADLERLAEQIQKAKTTLGDLKNAESRLKTERDEIVARKTHAEARLKIQSAIDEVGSKQNANGAFAALDSLRENVERLEMRADLDISENEGEAPVVSLDSLRREAREQEDLDELKELKRLRKGKLLISPANSVFTELNNQKTMEAVL